MAKKSKFNFANTPSANEIDEDMMSAGTQTITRSAAVTLPKKARSSRSQTSDWTLVQCRLPNDLNRRMNIYNIENDVTKNDFLIEAVRQLLNQLNA